jgi:hypothetical protein
MGKKPEVLRTTFRAVMSGGRSNVHYTVSVVGGTPIACTCDKFASNILLDNNYVCEHMKSVW